MPITVLWEFLFNELRFLSTCASLCLVVAMSSRQRASLAPFRPIRSIFISGPAMRLDLFSKGDSVLLLGEGNFSFSVCLHKHNLPIDMVATCFEIEPEFEDQVENVSYLKSHKVAVFFDVDATKLQENDQISKMKFSKIVFNFPHINGKMKIHLNRQLLRGAFESCSKILSENGRMIVSLCRGQGGTPADEPQRRWDDSWQVTEMAARGDFILTGVEPFLPENFPEYRCVGYRGGSVGFHLSGALVHVFAKREPPYAFYDESTVAGRLNLVPLTPDSDVWVPVIYSELYQSNPMKNSDSHVSFLKRLLVEKVGEMSKNGRWIHFDDDDIPVHEDGSEVSCLVNSVKFSLRSSPFRVLPKLLELIRDRKVENDLTFFPGMFFKRLGMDFLTSPPAEFHFIITGEDMLSKIRTFLSYLTDVFQEKTVRLCVREKSLSEESYEGRSISLPLDSLIEMVYESPKTGDWVPAAILCDFGRRGIGPQVCIVNVQAICQHFFQIGWREMWAEGTKVVLVDGKPTSRPGSLYPSSYTFDITLKYNKTFASERFCEILWLAAGRLIEGVESVNEYTSAEGWSSKCYRITYRSLEKPLYRSRVVEIQSKIVGRALELGLNVTIA